MKFLIPVFVTLACASCVSNSPKFTPVSGFNIPPEHRIISGAAFLHNATTKKAFKLAKNADIVIDYNSAGELDLRIRDGSKGRNYVDFKLADLVDYFDEQRHKDLIVIVFDKSMRSREQAYKEAGVLKDYFIARGYKRICVQQGYSTCRGIYLDHREP